MLVETIKSLYTSQIKNNSESDGTIDFKQHQVSEVLR